MTKKNSRRIPQVRQDRDYDYVYINKKKIMLGRSGTPESHTAYVELQAKLLADAAITKIVLQTGKLDIARAVAGQKSISVTQGYNHADVQIAIEQAVERSQ